jgi:hypothetical protein
MLAGWAPEEAKASGEASPPARVIAEPLSSGDAGALLELLATFPGGFRAVAGRASRRAPCTLVVARRDGPEEAELSFDPEGIAPDVQVPPVALARRLLALTRAERARRLGCVIASDIVIYNEEAVRRVRIGGPVTDDLAGDIEKGRAHFRERFPQDDEALYEAAIDEIVFEKGRSRKAP